MSHFTAQSFIFFGFIVAGEEIESKLRSLCVVFIYLACCLRSVWRVVTFSMTKPNFNVVYLGYDRNDLVRLFFTSQDIRSLRHVGHGTFCTKYHTWVILLAGSYSS